MQILETRVCAVRPELRPIFRELGFQEIHPDPDSGVGGGDGGIRTLDTLLGYAHLANECLQPLGHDSVRRLGSGSDGRGQPPIGVRRHEPDIHVDFPTSWRIWDRGFAA